ncbi:hypothetical protein [Rhizobium sp. L1K21]|uniref:hypothetical protein n=1 Tax=Rhizobium sp. L1K21 TaxID=2954933 RepID=UPI002093139E|nr:hypothetical protein [Rhizobium sp. L1K21]MCO6186420.1 hypothetical protein [Rhizobium sp. L1K21]
MTAAASLLSTAASADCTCVNKGGALYHLGERACINVGGKSYLAECQMNLNNTSWEKVEDGCPLTRLIEGQKMQSEWVKLPIPPFSHS